jgi:DNA polymerase (family X)
MNRQTFDTKQVQNEEIAHRFDTIAELLEAQNANPYRVRAYRTAAGTLRELDRSATEILADEGLKGLRQLPGVGRSLSRSIGQLAEGSEIDLLTRLRGEIEPAQVLATVPGLGPVLAERIYDQLGIATLADLESAAYDGRLAQVPGFGTNRIRSVRESLAGRLHRRRRTTLRAQPPQAANEPPVSELLDVDREYREKAAGDQLPRIAPRRYNPTREAWLPVLHTTRGDATYTALFSNSARAHELDAIHDWVVIYRGEQTNDGQWTVVTARYGPLQGKRVVRGREQESREYYQAQSTEPATVMA